MKAMVHHAAKGVTSMTDIEITERLSRLKQGDKNALCELYDGLSPAIYTVALRITNDRALAEDAVQELFIKLMKTPPAAELRKPRAYIFKAARNAALDILRKNPSHDDIEEHCDIPAPQKEEYSDVAEALNSLPEQQRSIVVMHINAGLKFREIAEITDIPLGTVLWRYKKAITAMKDALNGGTL